MDTNSNSQEMPKSVNPLQKYFRTPAIYLKLPSGGQYWPDDALELPINGEIPVFPMTQKDEIMLRTPDALMNGTAIYEVIKSCCPNIKDPWSMPSVDVDAVLIAVRIASYNNQMDITAKCPKCSETRDYGVDLAVTLDNIKMADFKHPLHVGELKIKLKPQSYLLLNQVNQVNFNQQRILQQISQDGVSDEVRTAELKKHMDAIVVANLDNLANSTESITANGEKVSDPKFIREFYENTESKIIKAVRTHLDKLNTDGAVKPYRVKCPEEECGHEFDLSIEFDYANFFA